MKPEDCNYGQALFDVTTDMICNIEPISILMLSEHHRITHFREQTYDDGTKVLVLAWHETGGNIPLPFDLNTPKLVAEFIKTWLSQKAIYPKDYCDSDGDTVEGVRITNNSKNISHDFYIVAVVEPTWLYYGK